MTVGHTENEEEFKKNHIPMVLTYRGTPYEILGRVTTDLMKLLDGHDAAAFVAEHPELQETFEKWTAKRLGREVYLGPFRESEDSPRSYDRS